MAYALEAISASTFGVVLHPTLEEKACVLAYAIVREHVFVDGNKRTGVEVLSLMLELNGRTLLATDDEIVSTMEGVAAGTMERGAFLQWIKMHAR